MGKRTSKTTPTDKNHPTAKQVFDGEETDSLTRHGCFGRFVSSRLSYVSKIFRGKSSSNDIAENKEKIRQASRNQSNKKTETKKAVKAMNGEPTKQAQGGPDNNADGVLDEYYDGTTEGPGKGVFIAATEVSGKRPVNMERDLVKGKHEEQNITKQSGTRCREDPVPRSMSRKPTIIKNGERDINDPCSAEGYKTFEETGENRKGNRYRRDSLPTPSDKERSVPKFGAWDVNDPLSADGFSVIFNKVKDEKQWSGQETRNDFIKVKSFDLRGIAGKGSDKNK